MGNFFWNPNLSRSPPHASPSPSRPADPSKPPIPASLPDAAKPLAGERARAPQRPVGRRRRTGHALQRACRPRAGKHATGTDSVVSGDDVPVTRYEGDVDRTAHRTRMDRGTGWKRQDLPAFAQADRQAGQTAQKARRALRLRIPPAQGAHSPPAPLALVGTEGHTTAPGRHGSSGVSRSCTSSRGAPRRTPATVKSLGHGR